MHDYKNDLYSLSLASNKTVEIYNNGTRDNPKINVLRDKLSGVIFTDQPCGNTDEYNQRKEQYAKSYKKNAKRLYNTVNRLEETKNLYVDRDILEFGHGLGDFIIEAQKYANTAKGVEVREEDIQHVRAQGIESKKSILEYSENSLDTVFLFHVFEHLTSPLDTLKNIHSRLKQDSGTIYIEVPHAKDFLLSTAKLNEFKEFTLWSDHLILHTRESLTRFLQEAGFNKISISGIQRYPLSNHLSWLLTKEPSGRNGPLSFLDSKELNIEYSKNLAKNNLTDTLVAIAHRG